MSTGAAGGGGLSPDTAALVAFTLEQAQVFLLTTLFSGILYGVHFLYAARYFRAFGGRGGDKWLMQVYVASSLVVGTIFLAVNTAVCWQWVSYAIVHGEADPNNPTAARAAWAWSLAVFSAIGEGYWVWRACRVTNQVAVRIAAIVFWLAAVAAFFAFSTVTDRQRKGETFTLRETQVYALVGIWLMTMDALWCAGVLMYELAWKRRALLVRSSVVSAFTALALSTSGLICLFTVAGALSMTVSFATHNIRAFEVFNLFASLFPFASCACTCFCLLHRNTLRLAAANSASFAHPSLLSASENGTAGGSAPSGSVRLVPLAPSSGGGSAQDKPAVASGQPCSLSPSAGRSRPRTTVPVSLPSLRWSLHRGDKDEAHKREMEERASGVSVQVEVQVEEDDADEFADEGRRWSARGRERDLEAARGRGVQAGAGE
ncbi:hypothetical protein JCM10449v2_002414 [Rhodotorula kratochvilovae]